MLLNSLTCFLVSLGVIVTVALVGYPLLFLFVILLRNIIPLIDDSLLLTLLATIIGVTISLLFVPLTVIPLACFIWLSYIKELQEI